MTVFQQFCINVFLTSLGQFYSILHAPEVLLVTSQRQNTLFFSTEVIVASWQTTKDSFISRLEADKLLHKYQEPDLLAAKDPVANFFFFLFVPFDFSCLATRQISHLEIYPPE